MVVIGRLFSENKYRQLHISMHGYGMYCKELINALVWNHSMQDDDNFSYKGLLCQCSNVPEQVQGRKLMSVICCSEWSWQTLKFGSTSLMLCNLTLNRRQRWQSNARLFFMMGVNILMTSLKMKILPSCHSIPLKEKCLLFSMGCSVVLGTIDFHCMKKRSSKYVIFVLHK